MAILNVTASTPTNNTTEFRNIRDAINKLTSGIMSTPNVVNIDAGTFSSVAYDPLLPQNSNTGSCGFFNPGLSRFASATGGTIDYITMQGYTDPGSGMPYDPITGDYFTKITNLDRIYVNAKDLGYSKPTNWTIQTTELNFNFTGSSEFILQAGEYGTNDNPLSTLSIDNVKFSGTHVGSSNNGQYSDLRALTGFNFSNNLVDKAFGQQQTFVAGTATTLSSGGSAFLFLQGTDTNISDNRFNESKYSNSVTIYDSTGLNLNSNRFDAGGQLKSRGQVVSNASGSISNNHFCGGTFLSLRKPTATTTTVSGNTFKATSESEPTTLVKGAKGIVLDPNSGDSSFAQFNSYSISGNNYNNVVPITINVSTGGTGLLTGQGNVYNPVTAQSQSFNNFVTGGSGADTLTGTSSTDFINGGAGSDSLTGGNQADAFAFTTTLSATNIDTITDWKVGTGSAGDRIWLDDAIFTPTPLLLGGFGTGAANAGKFYSGASAGSSGIINFDTSTKSLFYDPSDLGRFSGTGVVKICDLQATATNILATDLIVF